MIRFLRRNRKAVSPVIATIIIVAIAIVMSIAVAYWLMGLVGTGTAGEKLQFVSGYATTTGTTNEYFNITVQLKNVGSKDATIDLAFLNGKPSNDVNYVGNVDVSWNSTAVKVGESVIGQIRLLKTGGLTTWASGITVDVNIHTVAGYEYPKSVVLP